MIKFFQAFANISTYIAAFSMLLMCIAILSNRRILANSDAFSTCLQQTKTCRMASFAFTFLSWFLSSGQPTRECIQLYAQLAENCAKIGYVWIVFAFILILAGFFLSFAKRLPEDVRKLNQLRNSSFLQGAVYLFLAFLLDVQ